MITEIESGKTDSYKLPVSGMPSGLLDDVIPVAIKFSPETQQRIDSCAMNKVAQEKATE